MVVRTTHVIFFVNAASTNHQLPTFIFILLTQLGAILLGFEPTAHFPLKIGHSYTPICGKIFRQRKSENKV